MIRYVPVHRAMPGVQGWLRSRLGRDPNQAHWDGAEAYWLPDGRVLPATETVYWTMSPLERFYAMPVRAVVLEYAEAD